MVVTYYRQDNMVEICMDQERKDHFYEGWLYHFLVDPLLRRVHRLVRSQVKPGSTLIDIGCGTGELLFSMADLGSKLVGVENSKRMCSFANRQARRRGFNNVQIFFGDGAKLNNFPAGSFDYAIASMVLHEMDASQRLPVLKEMKRLAAHIIVVDYRVPSPTNLAVIICRFIERLAGLRHFRNYTSFINGGGLQSFYETLGLTVLREITFYSHSMHLVLIE
ncbi:MAG: class I SAM-dependent methyltransferase [Syntrophobacterales bacterium]